MTFTCRTFRSWTPRRSTRRGRLRGFTMLELQVAIILLAFGVVTLASLMTTHSRLLKRLEGTYRPGATVHVTRSPDPWVQKLRAAARITAAEQSPVAPTPVSNPKNTVTIVQQQADLEAESISVTADVTPIN